VKKPTGKIRRQRKPAKALPPLQPLDLLQRYPINVAARYLKQSIPTTYKQITSGQLETIMQGRRRYATGRGIAKLSLPPENAEAIGKIGAAG
jgi:hypothetical protein